MAEWDYVAKGGFDDADYAWGTSWRLGDELAPSGAMLGQLVPGVVPVR